MPSVLAKVAGDALSGDAIFSRFRGGAKAVLLEGDDRVHRLWKALIEKPEQSRIEGSRPFWQNSVLTLAQNHIEGRDDVGDMVRFAPGAYGHLARKIVTYPDPETGAMRLIPEQILDDHQPAVFDQSTLRLAWDLATDIYRSALPADYGPSDYAVTIQLLKYPNSAHGLDSMFGLLRDSGGPWTKLGQRVDSARALALGPFRRRYIREFFALASLVPGFRGLLHGINDLFRTDSRYLVDEDEIVVGPPHIDTARSLSMLSSDRDAIKTEIYDGTNWTELSLTPETLWVFPADEWDPGLSIPPTLHRYTIRKGDQTNSTERLNLTMLLGIVSKSLANAHPHRRLRNVRADFHDLACLSGPADGEKRQESISDRPR